MSHSVAGDASTGAAHPALHGLQVGRCVWLGTDADGAVLEKVSEVVAAVVFQPSVGS